MGVSITGTPKNNLLTQIDEFLSKRSQKRAYLALNRPLFITTPNPEQVVLSQKDPLFKKILNFSDISLCDGIGLLTAYEYFLRKNHNKSYFSYPSYLSNFPYFLLSLFSVMKNNSSSDGLKVIKGREFFLDLLEIANKRRYKVFLLGTMENFLKKAVNVLSKRYPAVQFQYEHNLYLNNDGVPMDKKQVTNEQNIIKNIQKLHSDMIFVAFGAPKQEKWVYRNINKLNTKLVMVVGSSLDYIGGTRKSVPKMATKFGLEWLWRLLTGSQSMKRVYNAVYKFPLLIIKH